MKTSTQNTSKTKKPKVRSYVYEATDGKLFMVRCADCGRENWAPAVASGQCAWCGYKAQKKDITK